MWNGYAILASLIWKRRSVLDRQTFSIFVLKTFCEAFADVLKRLGKQRMIESLLITLLVVIVLKTQKKIIMKKI